MKIRLIKVLLTTAIISLLVACQAHKHNDDTFLTSKPIPETSLIERIAFGSCYVPQFETPGVWKTIQASDPDVLLLLGDNVYQTEEKVQPELLELRQAYAQLAAELEFKQLREHTTVYAVWDDHDYGLNDAGGELPVKYESETLFEQVWPLSGPDPRKAREGIYFSRVIGPEGRRVQLIMLDTRFFRSRFPETSDSSASTEISMLGDQQWQWLKEQLLVPAELRLLVSSIPVLSLSGKGETWGGMPSEQKKLFKLIRDTKAEGVLFLSGDTHYATTNYSNDALGYRAIDVTASSLNFPYPESRRGDIKGQNSVFFDANFGSLDIDWEQRLVTIRLQSDTGEVLTQLEIPIDELSIH